MTKNKKECASPGNRTRISSLEGSHDNHYTRDAIEFKPNKETYIDHLHCYSFLWSIIIFSFFHRHQLFLTLLYGSAYLQKSLLHFSFVMTHEQSFLSLTLLYIMRKIHKSIKLFKLTKSTIQFF